MHLCVALSRSKKKAKLTITTGEGHFDDNKGSGAATPTAAEDLRAAKRKKAGGSKKAKTTKQRLAIADGQMDF
jgi:DNA helicase INO80